MYKYVSFCKLMLFSFRFSDVEVHPGDQFGYFIGTGGAVIHQISTPGLEHTREIRSDDPSFSPSLNFQTLVKST